VNNKIKTLYTVLNIKSKIPDQPLRLLYLKDVWGLDQNTIGELEDLSQPNVSKMSKAARVNKSAANMILDFTEKELKFVQSLSRSIITDMELIAFYTHILKLNINHPFFFSLDDEKFKICALHSLGIMNTKIESIFGRTQAGVSVIVKRHGHRAVKIERELRFDTTSTVYKIEKIIPENQLLPVENKFIVAGGQDNNV
jgi:transcriptional regulator